MGLFDTLMGNAGSIDLGTLAQQVGLNEDEVRNGGEALLSKLATGGHDADSATAAASDETGIAPEKLQALLPALSSAFGGDEAGGLSGFGAKLSGLLDRDGDGNPLNDLTGLAKGLFGKS